MTPSKRTGVICLITATCSFSSVPLFLRYFTDFLDAWTVNGVRYGVAMCVWLPFVWCNRRTTPPGRNIWREALPPATVNTIGQIGWALAPYYNEAAFIGFVIRSTFLFAILFGFWLVHEERAIGRRPLFWFGAAGIVAGILVMYRSGLTTGKVSPVGVLILLGTAACWGLYVVLVRKCMTGYDARLSFGIISLYTAVPLVVAMFAKGQWRALGTLSPRIGALVVVSALIGIALSHVLLYQAIHGLGAVITQGGLAIQPFLTALGACLILGESLLPVQWLGGVLLAISCLVLVATEYRSQRRAGD